jgi:hypothetical protein
MGWYNKETGKWEPFGSSPVSDAYWKLTAQEEDQAIRDLMASTACKFEEMPFEDFEGIAMDLSGPDPVFSKGWREFFGWE